MSLKKHRWTEEDDVVAFYLYRFKDNEDIPYSYENIANIRGFSVKSLESAILNFMAIDTGKGLKNYAKHQANTYKKYVDKPKEDMKEIVLKILSGEI